MKRLIAVLAAVVPLAVAAHQHEKGEKKPAAAGAPEMDWSKMGPNARKPTNEGQTRKEIQAFIKQDEELMKKGDFEGSLARYDFPVFMITDDVKGVPEARLYTREDYVQTMKPFWDNMPKDTKTTHKPTITVLSDSLVSVVDDFVMTMGKQKIKGKNHSLLVKRDGQWKWKAMTEAGWGGEPATGGASGEGARK